MNVGAALTFGAAMLCAGAASAAPADDLAAFMDSLAGYAGYAQVVATDDGGVAIEGLTISAALVVQNAGLPPATVEQPGGVTVSIDSLRLSEGAVATLVGTHSGAEPGPIMFAADGFRFDLATLAGSAEVDLLRSQLQADALEGSIDLAIVEPGGGSFEARLEVDLDQLGLLGLRLDLDEQGVQLPSGELWLSDSPGRGLAGFGAWIRLMGLESALVLMEHFPIPDTDARAQEAVAKLRAAIEASPSTGTEAAAALAAWAHEMAAALPEHAETLQAIAEFGEESGRLDITIAPPDRDAELVFNMFSGPDPVPTPEQVATTIETLGLSAAFAAE